MGEEIFMVNWKDDKLKIFFFLESTRVKVHHHLTNTSFDLQMRTKLGLKNSKVWGQ